MKRAISALRCLRDFSPRPAGAKNVLDIPVSAISGTHRLLPDAWRGCESAAAVNTRAFVRQIRS